VPVGAAGLAVGAEVAVASGAGGGVSVGWAGLVSGVGEGGATTPVGEGGTTVAVGAPNKLHDSDSTPATSGTATIQRLFIPDLHPFTIRSN
jgi:hypothetical protein